MTNIDSALDKITATRILSRLDKATCRFSDDPAKHDLELTCDECGEVICDMEDGDTIGILGSVVTDHQWTAHGWRGE